jgi:hypothetical protein
MSIAIRAQPLQYPSVQSAPSTFQGIVDAIAKYTLYQFDPDYMLLIKGPNTPQPQDQNKLWLKTDPVGRPLGLFILYNGNWRQVATGNPAEVTMFAGAWSTYFDATGLGLEGLPWDGWAISNGQNGTLDLTNRFVVPGYRCDGWGLWVTSVDGYDAYTGGRASFQIQTYNLPVMSITLNARDGYAYNGGAFAATNYGPNPQGGAVGIWQYTITGTGAQIPISLIPPYIALGFAQFIGYTN